ncbi:acyltransferase domain-containing protein [Okeania sp. SIO2B3]|uniref:acyl carrier protein n=1 Tax=Okeania sp. SIO2B3 TaxID=2607784 RepID=UPI00341910E1
MSNLELSLPVRAAIVASHPQEFTTHLETLLNKIQNSEFKVHNSSGVFLGIDGKNPRIGFLFPGQASPVYLNAGVWSRRFPFLQELYANANLPTVEDTKSTAIAQPAIVTSSTVGLRVLKQLGIVADVAVGHSLGELSALHWAGIFDETALVRIAKMRGKVIAELGNPTGKMASIGAGEQEVKALLNGRVVAIAGLNSPYQTIVSGEPNCVRQLVAQRTELPVASILDNHRLLSDLHLNSITVSQLVVEAARSLNLSPPIAPTDYADATVADIAQALEELSSIGETHSVEQVPSGVDSWIRTFTVELVELPLEVKSQKRVCNSEVSSECKTHSRQFGLGQVWENV